MKLKTVIWDCETDGLLDTVSKMHVLVLMEYETKRQFVFRNNDKENSIEKGVELLRNAELIVGHNILHYDIPVIEKLYGAFDPEGRIRDTLVLCRMLFANIKEADFGAFARGLIPGKMIGAHSLDAWGWRLRKNKGNYKQEMEAKGLDPWAAWNPEMEAYCFLDVEITAALWKRCIDTRFSEEAIVLEHRIHELMGVQERNGIPFDVATAEKLAVEVEEHAQALADQASAHYGHWYAPAKNYQVGPLWDDDEGINKAKEYKKPRTQYGEDDSRAMWAEVKVPARDLNYKDPMRGSYMKDVPYCPIQKKEFNPLSRQNVIDRFTTVYGWKPEAFTDTGRPQVNDDVLRGLVDQIPMAFELAEVYFYSKLLGQLKDGKNGWLKLVSPQGKIHAYTNVGGTVSGRASHNSPNIAQVPKVMTAKRVHPETQKKETHILKGRDGYYGWECRSLFHVPDGWKMVGCDLSGIEFRCLANMTARFDNGALIDVVLNGDIHEMNREAAGLESRDTAKTFIYAYCLPTDTTQALTRKGWKYRHELSVGDEILAYDSGTNTKRWTKIQSFADYKDAEVVRMRNSHAFDVECTEDHRWYIKQRKRTKSGSFSKQYQVSEVRRTFELTCDSSIITNAPMHPEEWDKPGIRGFLTQGKYGEDWTQRVLDMSQAERTAFLEGFLIADGYKGNTGGWRWCQNKNELAEAALLASYLVHDGFIHVTDRTNSPSPMLSAILSAKQHVTLQTMQITESRVCDVWCPNTEFGTWVMRQGNTITITGNCYGAGDWKLGHTVAPHETDDIKKKMGADLRKTFESRLPALSRAVSEIKQEARSKKYLIGLDGRKLYVRNEYSALNLKLQSDGALIAKQWLLEYEEALLDRGWHHGWDGDFAMLAWIHDETQNAVREEIAEEVAQIAVASARAAGEHFHFQCPVDAEAKIGKNWAETH
jgi:DNA polymerase I-like protein with 3'-5' exonuclease and polymerase domains